MRRTLKQLAYDLFMASRAVSRDAYFKHQASGAVYKVVGYCILEATGEPHVLYRPAKVNRPPEDRHQRDALGAYERPETECVFARPVVEFGQETEWHDGEMSRRGPRFKQVRKVEEWVDA